MNEFMTADQILDFAIQNEEDAVNLYTELAGATHSTAMRKELEHIANEERGHKAKLERVKSGKKLLSAEARVQTLNIDDYVVDVSLGQNPDYQSVLLFAMKQEKAAFKLYTDLANFAPDAELRELLLGLAQEEAKHKLKFELEYDDNVFKEN